MTHAVSLSYVRSDHMSPAAMAMALSLHAAVAAALWLVSPFSPIDHLHDAIEITMEAPPPPAAEPQQPAPQPAAPPPMAATPPPNATPGPVPAAPPTRLGLAPVGPSSDPRTPAGTSQTSPKPDTSADQATQPEPPKAEPPKPDPQQALATPPPPPPPSLEQALPPVEAPPPPLTSSDVPRPPPAPPPPPQRAQPAPRPPPPPQHQQQQQQQALQSSPLSRPQPRAPNEQQAARQAPTFVNPADVYGQRRFEDEYLWAVQRKISQHQEFIGNVTVASGALSLRLTIARDGRLLNVSISRSSGSAALDNASLHVARQAAPYPPLPPEIGGAQHIFILPLNFRRN